MGDGLTLVNGLCCVFCLCSAWGLQILTLSNWREMGLAVAWTEVILIRENPPEGTETLKERLDAA